MPVSKAVPALLSLLALSCTARHVDLVAEKNTLLQRDAEWSAAAAGTDVEQIVAYWTDDATIIPPGQPAVTGKEAIRQYVTGSLAIPGFKISWSATDVRLSPDGQMAYILEANEVTMNGPDGQPRTSHGRGVTVWRKEADGQWRCVVDTWNDEPGDAAQPT